MSIKLWHCHNARSLRALWSLEEMSIPYELVVLPFPPRVFQRNFLEVNELGTVPYFVDGDIHMTESSAIPVFLAERYSKPEFTLEASHPEYGDYLNWLFHSDATLTFPQTVYIRYQLQESPERGLQAAATDYARWFHARLRKLNGHLADGREFLAAGRFTVADIAIAYALHLGEVLKIDEPYTPPVRKYLNRMRDRPAFQKVVVIGEEHSAFNT
ncbi:glutathione S-transferase family protein [Spongiibacter nanhainus]|uniref:Glutathione S-transferase family protein n=1 Tax=Spongiibacter nanhainus TaxID=2794344 RepID=A0A7T4R1M2_9GAMM|nr:glutathione S-transferase family protein [Spongiibacter nanhainus]QQD18690.1 glutathione S-transferase family protein [Spongiibacter nanhainus]